MAQRVTIQDIADALGLSRNTVSKAINNTGVLNDTTREKVLRKASELGYKQFSYASFLQAGKTPAPALEENTIAVLSGSFIGGSHFASTTLDKLQREMRQIGYSITIHCVTAEEWRKKQLPITLVPEKTAGIVCFEIFDYDYAQMLCNTGIPTLFVDTPVTGLDFPLKTDILYMENTISVQALVREMTMRGKTKIGFIGDHMHCQSFHERFTAYEIAVQLLQLDYRKEFIIDDSDEDYRNHLKERLSSMKELPEVFLCANDFIAIEVMRSLRELGYSVPEDVYLCGFDDAPESSFLTPSLTTVHIHSQTMGFTAAQLLISRIREPTLNYRTVYTETEPVFRESTGKRGGRL